jgi:HlyD family secretion protein
MMRHTSRAVLLSLAMVLTACGGDDSARTPLETLTARAWHETLVASGELRAQKNTPLLVPGSQFEGRQLIEMVAEGSMVAKDQVVARFDAPQARIDLSQNELELLRNELTRVAQADTGGLTAQQLATDLAQVDTDLSLSQRYANADVSMFARNQILDALQDSGFLTEKKGYLGWRRGQTSERTETELAVIDSARATVAVTVEQKRASLNALEVRAPHAGVFLLKAGWDGVKAQPGSNLWPGDDFAEIPDMAGLIARFTLPQSQTQLLKEGQPVRVRLAGTGIEIDAEISKVSNSASVKNRDSPVKYSDFDVAIPEAAAKQHGLRPGQAVRGTVTLVKSSQALTVPNVALIQEGGRFFVLRKKSGAPERVAVELGQRGPIRSLVTSGLKEGDRIVLAPEMDQDRDAEPGNDTPRPPRSRKERA